MMTLNAESSATHGRSKQMFQTRHSSVNRWTGEFSDSTLTTMSPTKKHARDLNGSPLAYYTNQVQTRPRLLENGFIGNKDYDKLPENFKKLFSNDEKD